MKTKVIVALLCCYFSVAALAQPPLTDEAIVSYDTTTLPISKVLGVWEAEDSLKERIEFKYTGFSVDMLPKIHRTEYSFHSPNPKRVMSTGHVPNWPPFDCRIFIIGDNRIELIYFRLGRIDTRRIFRRIATQ